jgi:hypothetical protein
LGAGASKPAGIPTIDEMTSHFLADPFGSYRNIDTSKVHSWTSSLQNIRELTESYFGKLDLEYLMTMTMQLQEENFKRLAGVQNPEIKSIDTETLRFLKTIMTDFIRKEIEKSPDIKYLWGLQGFINEKQCLNLFTLNYDATIEIYCEQNNISCTDGFVPNWNPDVFNHVTINLFKLHGSLYWFKSEFGKILRVPLKGVSSSSVRYLTDEAVSEMMIYPALQKSKDSEVYSWLSQKFIQSLNKAQICVVIGYSFRDREILGLIQDAMFRNPNLWLVIASPSASSKRKLWNNNIEVLSRIVPFDMDARKAIAERHLQSNLVLLKEVREEEKKVWSKQALERRRLDSEWIPILTKYRRLRHYDRLLTVSERLVTYDFSSIPEGANNNIAWEIADLYLYKLEIQSVSSTTVQEAWKRLFVEYAKALEYAVFLQLSLPDQANPIRRDELPKWVGYFDKTQDYSLDRRIIETNDLCTKLLKASTDRIAKQNLQKLSESLDMISLNMYDLFENEEYGKEFLIDPNHSLDEIVSSYKEKDLGVGKWAEKIVKLP